jgi:hypothetical protein
MSPDRLPLFCDTALAERIERVEAELIARASEAAARRRTDTAGFVIPIAGGVATFAEEGSPFNKVAGHADVGEEPDPAAPHPQSEDGYRSCCSTQSRIRSISVSGRSVIPTAPLGVPSSSCVT